MHLHQAGKGRGGAENSTGMKQKGCPTHQQQHSIIELKILVNNYQRANEQCLCKQEQPLGAGNLLKLSGGQVHLSLI